MKIKNNILKISLVVAMVIGFNGCGSGDGDLENGGILGGQQDTQTTDNQNSGDFGTIVGGNQDAQGIWNNVNNNSNQQNILGNVEYDLVNYFYDYRTWVDGTTVVQTVYNYKLDGDVVRQDSTSELSFEKNNERVSVKEFKDNRENSIDFITSNAIKTYQYDEAGNAFEENSATMNRKARVGEELFSSTINSQLTTCRVGDHINSFSTDSIPTVASTGMVFQYADILKVDCSIGNDTLLSTYYANGYGQIMSVTVVNENDVSYSIVDKNSIQLFNIK